MTANPPRATLPPAATADHTTRSTVSGLGTLHRQGAAAANSARGAVAGPERPDRPPLGRSWPDPTAVAGWRAVPPDRAAIDDTPASNHILNYWLGESRNFAPDRNLADRLTAAVPALPATTRAARRYRRDTLHAARADGIAQILDLGAGIPTRDGDLLPGTVAGREVRAAYIDNDPVAVAALRRLARTTEPWLLAVCGDLATPDALLDLLTDRGVVDPAAATLALLAMTLHHLTDFQALHLLSVLHRRLAPGSRLMVTAFVADPLTAERRDTITALYTATPGLVLRTAARTRSLLTEAGWPTRRGTGRAGLFAAVAHRQPDPPAEPEPAP
jgi:SAM-dependent methyltransferase